MAAYAVLTTDDTSQPNLSVFESLIGANGSKPMARFGWSSRDDEDLRRLAAAKEKSKWSKGKKGERWDEVWKGRAFFDRVKVGDLLFYKSLPAKGRFTLVKVTGDYGYLRKEEVDNKNPYSKGFRSYRLCKVIAEDVLLSDGKVSAKLRTYLNLQGRIYEIRGDHGQKFVNGWKGGGGNDNRGSKGGGAHANDGGVGEELEKYKKKFSYAIGAHSVTVNKDHQAYQLRLKRFLERRGLTPQLEKKYIDVEFEIGSERFIGEIKVTKNWLSIEEAFRIALGQILDYGHAHSEDEPKLLVMFDRTVDSRHVQLADALNVGVVFELTKGRFKILNPKTVPALEKIFEAA